MSLFGNRQNKNPSSRSTRQRIRYEEPAPRGFLGRSRIDFSGLNRFASNRDFDAVREELKAHEEEVDLPIRQRDTTPPFRRAIPAPVDLHGWEFVDKLRSGEIAPGRVSSAFLSIWQELDFDFDYDNLAEKGFMALDENGIIRVQQHKKAPAKAWMFYTIHLAYHLALGYFQPPAGFAHPALWHLAVEMLVNQRTASIDRLPLPKGFPNYRIPPRLGFGAFGKTYSESVAYPTPESLVEGWLQKGRKINTTLWHSPAGHGIWDVQGHPPQHFSRRFRSLEILNDFRALKPIDQRRRYPDGGKIARAYKWIETNFPLLSACTNEFLLDYDNAERYNVALGAVAAEEHIIFVNPNAPLSELEWRWVLVHEILHVVMEHHKRKEDRHHLLWNVACDYVINNWLEHMGVGMRPQGVLFKPSYAGRDAESIYDELLQNGGNDEVKVTTLRGDGLGDILDFDENFQNSRDPNQKRHRSRFRPSVRQLAQKAARQIMDGDHPGGMGRDDLPGDFIEELDLSRTRTEEIPVANWEVELAQWMDLQLNPKLPSRSYARRSRRQSAAPEIPLAGRAARGLDSPTLGVVLDTSGSMSTHLLQKGLAAVIRFAEYHGVAMVRLVMCDTQPYDEGYISLEKLKKPFRVFGRGGTVLQPSIDLLHESQDFPEDAPVLIVTDGQIEDHLDIYHEHAYLLPGNGKLPFEPEGPTFNILGEQQRFGRPASNDPNP